MLFTGFGIILSAQNMLLIRGGYSQSFPYNIGSRHGTSKLLDSRPACYLGFSYFKDYDKILHWETSADVVAKNVSVKNYYGSPLTSGFTDCDYQLNYIELSSFPVIEFSNKLIITGSIRPNLGILVYSHREGIQYFSSQLLPESDTSQISENASKSI